MVLRRVLAVAACTAAVVGVGAGSAFAGEITGNGKWIAGSETAPLKGKSECAYSGLNDNYVLGNPVPDADGFTHVEHGVFFDQFWADAPNREAGSRGLLDALAAHLA